MKNSFSVEQLRFVLLKCVVSKNAHTPPTEGIGNSWGWEGPQRPKMLRKCMKLLNWNSQRGGGGEGLRKHSFHGGGMGNLKYALYTIQ